MYYTRTSTVMVRTIWISIRDRPFAKLAKIFTSFAAGTSSEAGVQTGWKWNRWMATHWHFLPTAQFLDGSRQPNKRNRWVKLAYRRFFGAKRLVLIRLIESPTR